MASRLTNLGNACRASGDLNGARERYERALRIGEKLDIGTGGFARMFDHEKLFDEIMPELVLWGLKYADALNRA